MKNGSSLKSSAKNESPKTPGGISKSLLTPCRRVGLSRNWKKKGPSPFISPLNSTPTNIEIKVEIKETRKRKSIVEEKANENDDPEDEVNDVPASEDVEIVKTPLRNVELPRRKKSKTFLATLNSQEINANEAKSISPSIDECTENITPEAAAVSINSDISLANSNFEETNEKAKDEPEPKKATPISNKFRTPVNSKDTTTVVDKTNAIEETNKETDKEVAKPKKMKSESKTAKVKSPNELTKECIVVIQKKLLKVKEKYYNNYKTDTETNKVKESSQPLFDSDSDDTPLSTLNKQENIPVEKAIALSDEDEFVATESKTKKKVESKKNAKTYTNNSKAKTQKPPEPKPIPESRTLQSSFDDDEDFIDKKKTIIIRKTYDKVVKPQKAKSTGSITQRDIDNLKARIEVKKKLLLARAMTEDTEELRSLIKRWQKGCQEALVELMDLMKIKCPDKHNMDYSEILQMLKIPPSLVGYDSDHDCFNTPDDSTAALSKFNDF